MTARVALVFENGHDYFPSFFLPSPPEMTASPAAAPRIAQTAGEAGPIQVLPAQVIKVA